MSVAALAGAPRHLERDHLGAERLETLAEGFLVQSDFLQNGRREIRRDGTQSRIMCDLATREGHVRTPMRLA